MSIASPIYLPGHKALIVGGFFAIDAAACCCGGGPGPCIECTLSDCTYCEDTLSDYSFHSVIVTGPTGNIVVEKTITVVGMEFLGGDFGTCGALEGVGTMHDTTTINGVVVSDTTTDVTITAGITGSTGWAIKLDGANFTARLGTCGGFEFEDHSPGSDIVETLALYRPE